MVIGVGDSLLDMVSFHVLNFGYYPDIYLKILGGKK